MRSLFSKLVLLVVLVLPLQGCVTRFMLYGHYHDKYELKASYYDVSLSGLHENIQRYNLKILVDSVDVTDAFGEI